MKTVPLTRISFLILTLFLFERCNQNDNQQHLDAYQTLTLPLIEQYYMTKYSQNISHILQVASTDPKSIFRYEQALVSDEDRSRLFLNGMNTVQEAYYLYRETKDEKLMQFATNYADYLIELFAQPEGHFIEYEKAPWLTTETLWYTIPWGTAFSGTEMLETYQLLKEHFNEEQLYRWNKHLTNTADWIYENPILGSYVFNCTIDLCHLLWKIGKELDNESWKSWALTSAKGLIDREVDQEGWIHGEHGVSPAYQLLGSDFLALFAWDSKDSSLIETTHKLANVIIRYSTPSLYWNGNFGTRSNALDQIGKLSGKHCLMVSAAYDNEEAAYLVHQYGEPYWSNHMDIWETVLAKNGASPEYQQLQEFNGIDSYVFRKNGWQAWFNNYDESLWAKGFTGLWHESLEQVAFSTLHSLPTDVEKAKLRLGDTRDWAGFPHIRIEHGGIPYDSHQELIHFEADTTGNVHWIEPLLSPKGTKGGSMSCNYRFADTLQLMISLEKLVGQPVADFHLMRKEDQYFTIWPEESLEVYVAGRLPENNLRELSFDANEHQRVGLQINQQVFCFQWDKLPDGSFVTVGLLKAEGLHTRNYGGARVRIELPEGMDNAELALKFYQVKPRM